MIGSSGTGNIRMEGVDSSNASAGSLRVVANSLHVAGDIDAHTPAYQAYGGNVDIDVLEDVTIEGIVRADNSRASHYNNRSPGHVDIQGKHIAVMGTDANGVSILTDPSYGSWYSPAAGDGDVTLEGVDTSTALYDSGDPLGGDTSSIYVAGKIDTGYSGSTTAGKVVVSAVEVQLGADVETENATHSTIDIHYGVLDYGITTHLVEGGVRWDGSSAHNIACGAGPVTYTADVPYAGVPEPATLGLLALGFLPVAIRRRRGR